VDLTAKQVVPWIIGFALIVALAGFVCGAYGSRMYAACCGGRGAAVAPDPDATEVSMEQLEEGPVDSASPGGASSASRVARSRAGSETTQAGCCVPWVTGGDEEDAPQRRDSGPHALRRLSDLLTRRVRLMKIISSNGGAGSRAASRAASAAVSPEVRAGSVTPELLPPPLPERPWRMRRAPSERDADDDPSRDPA
jgi:hypothetical protein